MVVGADWCSPQEFWQLRPGEVFWLINSKSQVTQEQNKWADLYDLLKADPQ